MRDSDDISLLEAKLLPSGLREAGFVAFEDVGNHMEERRGDRTPLVMDLDLRARIEALGAADATIRPQKDEGRAGSDHAQTPGAQSG
ncbi:hypothetical protein GCM10007148_27170 [Parvularcula lutaonensis]|nr:hypothetical protein GCM10007148_27170 [Parvularcula lutaonensis]